MTLEEAIKHCEEVADEQEKKANAQNPFYTETKKKCFKCATEHRQLAEWLRKYQKIIEIYGNWNVDFGIESCRAMIKIGDVLNGNDKYDYRSMRPLKN